MRRLDHSEGPVLRTLMSTPSWRRWTMASLLARMPVSMALLGVMLAVKEVTGSLGTGSQVVGVMTISAGVLGPAAGRWLDRHELRRALQVRCAAMGATFMVMAACVQASAPTWVFFAVSFFAGVTLAGVWGGFRALLLVVIPPEQRRHAHFVESLMIEVTYGIGPLSIGLVIALTDAAVGLIVMGAFSFGAALSLMRLPRHEPHLLRRPTAPWRHPTFAVVYVFGFFLGMAFGAVESNVAARMDDYGLESSAAGGFIGLLGVSSCIGGVWVSVRPMRITDSMRTAAFMFATFGICLLPSVFAPNIWIFGAALLFASFMLVPLNGLGAAEIEAGANDGQRAEAFAYLMAATQLGSGIGVLLNGTLTNVLAPRTVPLLAASLLLALAMSMFVLRRLNVRRRSFGRSADGASLAEFSYESSQGLETPLAGELLDRGVDLQ
jgi:MFS family permease